MKDFKFYSDWGFEFKYNILDKLVRNRYTVSGKIGQTGKGEYEICTRMPQEVDGCIPEEPMRGFGHMAHVAVHKLVKSKTGDMHGYCPICNERYCITCFYTAPKTNKKATNKKAKK